MPRLTSYLKRHVIWIGFLAALVPLIVLLSLQYGWLVSLEKTSVLAHQATLNNYLEAVASEVQYFYQGAAERSLNVPSALFTQHRLDKGAYHFEKKGAQGAKYLFLLSLHGEDMGKLYFYDPAIPSMEMPADSPAMRAVYVAAAPWLMMSKKQATLASASVTADERDGDNRIILNPITDEQWHLVGIAGMIVDQKFFKQAVLPKAIKKSLPAFFSEGDWKNLFVTVRDAKGELKFTTGECDEGTGGTEEARKAFTFIFADWHLGLRTTHVNPREWAEANFALNMGLSVLLGVVLMGGMALALRTASREMKLSQMKGDFVSNVSHELRTPLASIRVFGEFLKLGRAATPDKVREYGEYIETESRRLTRLINNILDFSKIESGRKTYQFRPADISEVVEETLKTFEVRLRNSGFVIHLERPEGPLPPVMIDGDAIGQALSNLLDNAAKYSNGAREIGVRLRREEDWIVIAVKDSGIGISKEEQKKIFERFHRVSTGLVHDVKGSGLGLSIVSHIVEAHRGKVTVESEPGAGSTFSIRLPIVEGGARAVVEVDRPAGEAHGMSPEDSHA
jgi:signal transduction histidine kinase